MTKISGLTLARNVVKLDYPIAACVDALSKVVDQVVICFDPTTDDGTFEVCQDLKNTYDCKLVESPWDMENRKAGTEIGMQTDVGLRHCDYDWHLYCQLDEAFHEEDNHSLHGLVANAGNVAGFEFQRVCFYADLQRIRRDWTIRAVRLTKKGTHSYSSLDGHNCVPLDRNSQKVFVPNVWMYHYSRFGDPLVISQKIRTLDSLFHAEENLIPEAGIIPYDFQTRNIDSFAVKNEDLRGVQSDFLTYAGSHPRAFGELFKNA